MAKNIDKSYYIFLNFFMLFVIISCNSKPIEIKTKNQNTKTIENTISFDTIKLSEYIEVIREIKNNQFSIDFLELNQYRIDSSKTIPMLDPSECNFILKSGNRVDTTYKCYSIFGNYLLITKDEVQTTSIKIYNIETKKRLPILNTEELIVDTNKNELFLIYDRGILRNYILKLKIQGDQFLKLDSIENTEKNRKKIRLEN